MFADELAPYAGTPRYYNLHYQRNLLAGTVIPTKRLVENNSCHGNQFTVLRADALHWSSQSQSTG
jgi:hypothetical protein